MTILRLLALALIVLALAPTAARAETAAPPAGQKIEPANLEGLVFAVTIPAASKKKPRPAPLGALAETGHTLTIQGGKLVFAIQGLPPIPPIGFHAYKQGDMVRIVTTDAAEVLDKANKSARIGSLLPSGCINDNGKGITGTMIWTIGEGKDKKKVEVEFDGRRPEKPEKSDKK